MIKKIMIAFILMVIFVIGIFPQCVLADTSKNPYIGPFSFQYSPMTDSEVSAKLNAAPLAPEGGGVLPQLSGNKYEIKNAQGLALNLMFDAQGAGVSVTAQFPPAGGVTRQVDFKSEYAGLASRDFVLVGFRTPNDARAWIIVWNLKSGLATAYEVYFAQTGTSATSTPSREARRNVYLGYVEGIGSPEILPKATNRLTGKVVLWENNLGSFYTNYGTRAWSAFYPIGQPEGLVGSWAVPSDFYDLHDARHFVYSRTESYYSAATQVELLDLNLLTQIGLKIGFDKADELEFKLYSGKGKILGSYASYGGFAANEQTGGRFTYRPNGEKLTKEEVTAAIEKEGSWTGAFGGAGKEEKMYPSTDKLSGMSFSLAFDDGLSLEYEFTGKNEMKFREAGAQDWKTGRYEAFEVDINLIFFTHAIDDKFPDKIYLNVVDFDNGLATCMNSEILVNESFPRMCVPSFHFGVLKMAGITPASQRHGFSDDLMGKSIVWTYNDAMVSQHYFSTPNSLYYAIMGTNGDAFLMWSTDAWYVKFRDNVFLISWMESYSSGQNDTKIFNLNTMHDVGVCFGIPDGAPFEYNTFGSEARHAGTVDVSSIYGTDNKVDISNDDSIIINPYSPPNVPDSSGNGNPSKNPYIGPFSFQYNPMTDAEVSAKLNAAPLAPNGGGVLPQLSGNKYEIKNAQGLALNLTFDAQGAGVSVSAQLPPVGGVSRQLDFKSEYAGLASGDFVLVGFRTPNEARAWVVVINIKSGLTTAYEVYFARTGTSATSTPSREARRNVYLGYVEGIGSPEILPTVTNRLTGKTVLWENDLGSFYTNYGNRAWSTFYPLGQQEYLNASWAAPSDYYDFHDVRHYLYSRTESVFSAATQIELIDLQLLSQIGLRIGFDANDDLEFKFFSGKGEILGSFAGYGGFAANEQTGGRFTYRPNGEKLTKEQVIEAIQKEGSWTGAFGGAGKEEKMYPLTDKLNGKSFSLVFDDGLKLEYEFTGENELKFREVGAQDWKTGRYEAFEVDDNLIFFTHAIDDKFPDKIYLNIVDFDNGLATCMNSEILVNESFPRMCVPTFHFGVLNMDGITPISQRHGFSDGLMGKSVVWTYNDAMVSQHYFSTPNSLYYAIMGTNGDAFLMWSTDAWYVKFRENVFLISWMESYSSGQNDTKIFNLNTMHDAGVCFGIPDGAPFEYNTFGSEARYAGTADVSKIYDVKAEDSKYYNPAFTVTSEKPRTVMLITAAYDDKGKLVDLRTNSVALSENVSAVLQAPLPKNPSAETYKYFIWDSNYVPLTAINSI